MHNLHSGDQPLSPRSAAAIEEAAEVPRHPVPPPGPPPPAPPASASPAASLSFESRFECGNLHRAIQALHRRADSRARPPR
jgi:hypothetical protein